MIVVQADFVGIGSTTSDATGNCPRLQQLAELQFALQKAFATIEEVAGIMLEESGRLHTKAGSTGSLSLLRPLWRQDAGATDESSSSFGYESEAHEGLSCRMTTTAATSSSRPATSSSFSLRQYEVKGLETIYPDVKCLTLPQVKTLIVTPISQRRGPRGGVSEPFPMKLYEMLIFVEQQPHWKKLVGWRDHGRCFMISHPHDFVAQLMPRFFKQTKLTSFQRQLNLYGFLKITDGPDKGAYYHPLFLRGRDDIAPCLVRIRTRGQPQMILSTEAPNQFIFSLYDLPYCNAVASSTAHPMEPLTLQMPMLADPKTKCIENHAQQHEKDDDGDDLLMDGLMEFLDEPSDPSRAPYWQDGPEEEPDYGGCVPMFQSPEYTMVGVFAGRTFQTTEL